MKVVRCATTNQVCWFCSPKQQRACDDVVAENYYKPVRPPEVRKIIQRRLVWAG